MKRAEGRLRKMVGLLLSVLLAGQLCVPAQAAPEDGEGVYLLVGYDQQENETARSDTMILCRFDKENRQLVLVSLLRDLYVSIPGHGRNRLNAAYALGGIGLLKATIEENFRIPVEATIEVEFSRFSRIIDQLGGVELELREDEAKLIGRETGTELEPGKQRLTGQQALCYARIRCLDTDGDFSRTGRQRKVLRALWEAYKSSSLPELIRVMGTLAPMLRMDLDRTSLLRTAMDVFPYIRDMELIGSSIPEQGSCVDRNINGMAVLVADMERIRRQLREHLYPDYEKIE